MPRAEILGIMLAAAFASACQTGPGGPRPAPLPPRRSSDQQPRSNILRGDYAGSQACAPCHEAIYEAWRKSPMHNMTRLPEDAQVAAPFGHGEGFTFKNDRASFERQGNARFMRLASVEFGDHLFRVTKVIGGRHREDFAGIEVASTAAGAPAVGPALDEQILPVSWVRGSPADGGGFRLKGYSVMVRERPGLRAGGSWNRTCVLCHNTAPQFVSLLGALHGTGAPGYQGQVVDRVMPADRRWSWRVTNDDALTAALQDERRFLGVPAGAQESHDDNHALLAQTVRDVRDRLVPAHLVEIGIGCESCHGGSREHVTHTRVLPTFEPRSTFLRPQPAAGAGGDGEISAAQWQNRACARCHQVLFTRYPYTWEGGTRRQDPGGSHVNSGEARDFLLGGCAQAMGCSTCHDPHAGSNRAALEAMATPAGNRICVGCHSKYADPPALRAHAHHDPTGAGGACVACHMPRKNMGLGYDLTRYHRIGSPTDPSRVEHDRPLECAFCHPRATVAQLVGSMESFWGKRYDRGALERLYGRMSAPVLPATALRGKPHEQAAALAALGDARLPDAVPLLTEGLLHEYPLVRFYARRALGKTLGHPVTIDVQGNEDDLRAQILAKFGPNALPVRPARNPDRRPAGARDADDED